MITIVMGNFTNYEGSYEWPVVAYTDKAAGTKRAEEMEAQARLLDEQWKKFSAEIRQDWNTMSSDERIAQFKRQEAERDRLKAEHPDPNYRVGDEYYYDTTDIELV